MNIWRRGNLHDNPYYRTAFRVARVPREVSRHRTLVQLIGQVRRIVETDPQAHLIAGKPVSLTEINTAEQILSDPKQRILEELLTHSSESFSPKALKEQVERLDEKLREGTGGPLPIRDLSVLMPLSQAMINLFLQAAPGPDASFGALELDLLPPFGRLEE